MSQFEQDNFKQQEPVQIKTPRARGGRGSARVLNEGVLSNQSFGADRKPRRTGRADLTQGKIQGPCVLCDSLEACQMLGVRNANSGDCANRY